MKTHDRFDEAHRAACNDCMDAYMDFMFEQADEERLDAMDIAAEGV